jgi:beta-galactosidase
MEAIHHDLLDAGFTKAMMYTADGADEVPAGSLPELPAAINFGTGDAKGEFAKIKKMRPDGPFMAGEYWDGWFDHWGAPHAQTDGKKQAEELDWMLQQGYSVSLYMFHGGTSFGWMNGANSNGKNYEPDVTSYDYDSPLDESGRPTPKYFLFRDVIAKDTGATLPPVPAAEPVITVPSVTLTESASLWKTLPSPVKSEQPLSMEDLGQAYGYILYRTELNGPVAGELAIDTLHDYAQVYVDGKLAGTIDRRLDQKTLALHVSSAHAQLDILVENTGRVNYGHALPGERAGIVGSVTLAGHALTGWENDSLPMKAPEKLPYNGDACSGACFYRATFTVSRTGDTFLDTSALTKGEVWVNGRPLGRFWNVGPQKTLYLPASWLKTGENEVIVFDLDGKPGRTVQGLDRSVLNAAVVKGS